MNCSRLMLYYFLFYIYSNSYFNSMLKYTFQVVNLMCFFLFCFCCRRLFCFMFCVWIIFIDYGVPFSFCSSFLHLALYNQLYHQGVKSNFQLFMNLKVKLCFRLIYSKVLTLKTDWNCSFYLVKDFINLFWPSRLVRKCSILPCFTPSFQNF